MFKTIKHIHFVGIGGAGMSGIAEVLLKLGYVVTGSDLAEGAVVERLRKLGAKIAIGHRADNVKGAHVVVTSTAVSKTNPEVKQALAVDIPVIPRIEMLAEIARLKYTIAIAGTHGKTTTTSLVGRILMSSGLDPTVIVGGRLRSVGTGGVLGKGDFLVAEADESDGSFLKLSPAVSVITNIDDDHMDYYKTEKNLLNAFATFADKIPFYGVTLICADDPGVRKIISRIQRKYETYGLGKNVDWQASKIVMTEFGATFQVTYKGQVLGMINSPLSGTHNVLNCLAAIGVSTHIGISFDRIAQGVADFDGVGRRIEFKGNIGGAIIVDDYGHHPTEIKATLQALRSRWPKARLTVLFQPHRYSRTKALYREFAHVLSEADQLYLLPIYAAGEKPIKGVSTHLIAKNLKKKEGKLWVGDTSFRELHESLRPTDVVLTLGAGDVWKIGEKLLKEASPLVAKIASALPKLGPRLKLAEPLARHTTWAIGGPADVYAEVHNLEELKTVQSICRAMNVPIFILGWGSNVLLPDEGIRGCVIRLRGEFETIQFNGNKVKVGGGVHLPRLANICANRNLSGTEALAGVPGTVGGALMTNAGTPRGVIGDVVESVEVLEADGKTKIIPKAELRLGYRSSNLLGRWIIGAELLLQPSTNGGSKEKIKEELTHREKTQPLGTKNVGSVFKNPPNDHAARLIEAVGLKGKAVGRVRFSPKHANFMENTGGASAKEVLALMSEAQKLVKQKFGVDLEPEVKIIGAQGPHTNG
jgi:UDP-N-acetylmuramate--alanine ligase